MPIQPGETIPPMKLTRSTPDGPTETSTEELFGGKTVVLFGVPGAFTPTCSARHLPGFVEHADALKPVRIAQSRGSLVIAHGRLEIALRAPTGGVHDGKAHHAIQFRQGTLQRARAA